MVNSPVQSQPKEIENFIISKDDQVLITGATGFIGARVVDRLLTRGFRNLVCFVRPSSSMTRLNSAVDQHVADARVRIIEGNLLSRKDCEEACKDTKMILHLAAGTGEKSFPDAYMNSVVTTRNLLDGSLKSGGLKRFVVVSSFAVYSNLQKAKRRLLDETCPVDDRPELREEAYCFAKVHQERLVAEYGKQHGVPYVVIRPGSVYGPGKKEIAGRIGIGTFGVFLHLGGFNRIPFTYVDNCAEAIVLAGLVKGVDGEAFNIIDDNLPTSRQFLRRYKRNVRRFRSVYVPKVVSHLLCLMWERYARWSKGQLSPVFNGRRWHAYWKNTNYSNRKLKERLGWVPVISTADGLQKYFEAAARKERNA
jgi:nucleoside-diphosphate-sugar epimerase